MMINNDSKKIISIAEKPGTFGLKFHNSGYNMLGLNYIYIPLKIPSFSDFKSIIQLIRDNFHGCSVSMPYKIKVMDFLDELDKSAEKTEAVNTILNQSGKLKGFNTDYYGAKESIEKNLESIKNKKIFMIGAGGVAKAVAHAVKDLGGKLYISNRTELNSKELANKLNAHVIPWEDKNLIGGYLLINATSVGMNNLEEMIVSKDTISNFEAVMDVIVNSKTKLIRTAKELGKKTIHGGIMTTYQAEKQFEIYTEKKLTPEFINYTINNFEK